MIKKLTIKNYQSHKDSEFIFTEGINVIIGDSDVGKSAIKRAIRKTLFNRPLGTSFIRQGTKQCNIIIETEKGVVERAIGKDNYYKVNEDEFRSVGSDVPEDVKDVLNIGEINVQNQLDKHFLILGSGGEIASTLNEVLNIDEIDKSISHCSSKVRSLDKEVSIMKAQLEEEKEELKKYNNLDEIIKKIDKWKEDEDELSDKRHRINDIYAIVKTINEIQAEQDKYKDVTIIIAKINKLDKEITKLEKIEEEAYLLGMLCDDIAEAKNKIVEYKDIDKIIEKIIVLDLTIHEENDIMNEFVEIQDLCSDIEDVEVEYLDSICDVDNIKEDLSKLQNKYLVILREMKLCPFCGQAMEEDLCLKITSKI